MFRKFGNALITVLILIYLYIGTLISDNTVAYFLGTLCNHLINYIISSFIVPNLLA